MRNVKTQGHISTEDCNKIDELCLWIDANINKSISWTELTDHCGWQHSELIKKFVEHKNTTPMSYIIERIKSKRIKSPIKPPTIDAFLRLKNLPK